jgi:hypothetical protein
LLWVKRLATRRAKAMKLSQSVKAMRWALAWRGLAFLSWLAFLSPQANSRELAYLRDIGQLQRQLRQLAKPFQLQLPSVRGVGFADA